MVLHILHKIPAVRHREKHSPLLFAQLTHLGVAKPFNSVDTVIGSHQALCAAAFYRVLKRLKIIIMLKTQGNRRVVAAAVLLVIIRVKVLQGRYKAGIALIAPDHTLSVLR